MRTCILLTLAASSVAFAQNFTIDFNNLSPGTTLSSQYLASNGVSFFPNAFAGANANNTAEPWATNTGLTISDYVPLDPARPGYAVGTPMLFDGNLVRTVADYLNEDGDASVLTTFATPISTATVTFVGIVFGVDGARDTQLIALDAGNNILAQTRAAGRDTTNQQNLTVNVPGGFTRLAIVPGNYNDTVGFDNLVYTVAQTSQSWNVDADGAYWSAANWTNNDIPSGAMETARFGNVITQPRSVTINDHVPINKVIFDSAVSYTLAKPSGYATFIDFRGVNPELVVSQGSHQIEPDVTGSSNLTKSGIGTVSISKLKITGELGVNEGAIHLNSGPAVASRVGSLSVATGADLALNESPLIIASISPTAVRGLLQSGNLTSGAGSSLALGYAVGATLAFNTVGGENLAATDTLVRPTLAGDADLDLHVDFDDLLSLAQSYNPTVDTRNWRQGDFTYNGIVDFDDLLLLAQNYGGSTLNGAQFSMLDANVAADWVLAMSIVPEPTMSLGLVGTMFVRRRRLG